MAINARRKEYIQPVKHRGIIVMGVVSISMHPLKCVVLRTARGVSIIHTVKQSLHLPRKKCNEMRWPHGEWTHVF
jgi:hypothetical protein